MITTHLSKDVRSHNYSASFLLAIGGNASLVSPPPPLLTSVCFETTILTAASSET
jgi:hypothetical protein